MGFISILIFIMFRVKLKFLLLRIQEELDIKLGVGSKYESG